MIGEAWLCGYRFHADARALVPRSPIAEAVTGGALDPFLSDRRAARGTRPVRRLGEPRHHRRRPLARRDRRRQRQSRPLRWRWRPATSRSTRWSERVRLVEADLYGGLRRQRFDLILCNPPYVNARSMAALAAEFRPSRARRWPAAPTAWILITRIIAGARRHLEPDGLLVVEIGHEADAFERRFARTGHAWIPVAAGDRMLAAIRASGLPTGAG